MKQLIELYTGESVEIGGVRVKCEKAISHRPGGGPPRHGVVLEYDDAEKMVEKVADDETSEAESDDSGN